MPPPAGEEARAGRLQSGARGAPAQPLPLAAADGSRLAALRVGTGGARRSSGPNGSAAADGRAGRRPPLSAALLGRGSRPSPVANPRRVPGAARCGRYGRSAAAECRNRGARRSRAAARPSLPSRGGAGPGAGKRLLHLPTGGAERGTGARRCCPAAACGAAAQGSGNGRGRRCPAGAGAAPSLCFTSSWNDRFYLYISLKVKSEFLKLRQGSEIAGGGEGEGSVLQTFCFPTGGLWTASEGRPCEVGCCFGCRSAEKRVGTRVQNAAYQCRSSAAACRAAPC